MLNKKVSANPLIATLWICAVIIFGFAINGLVSCASTGEPNWPMISQELTLGAADIRDVASLVDDNDLAEGMVAVAEVLEVASKQVTDAPSDLADTIDMGLELMSALITYVDEEDQPDAKVALLLARSALRRYRAYLPVPIND